MSNYHFFLWLYSTILSAFMSVACSFCSFVSHLMSDSYLKIVSARPVSRVIIRIHIWSLHECLVIWILADQESICRSVSSVLFTS